MTTTKKQTKKTSKCFNRKMTKFTLLIGQFLAVMIGSKDYNMLEI